MCETSFYNGEFVGVPAFRGNLFGKCFTDKTVIIVLLLSESGKMVSSTFSSFPPRISNAFFASFISSWMFGPFKQIHFPPTLTSGFIYSSKTFSFATALDVTIQAQILELIKDLQEKTGVAVIFITHDLGVVANMADRVAVMYAGKIIEYGTSDDIFYDPKHPYTWGLLGSMPTLDIGDNDLYNIPGTPPDLMDPPKGDAFALRSAYAMKIDHLAEPPMFKVSDTHYAATWLLHPLAPKIERPVNVGRKKVNINE